MFVFVSIFLHICVYVYVCICIFMHRHVTAVTITQDHSLVNWLSWQWGTGICIFISLCICICICVFIWICICTCIHKVSQASSQYDSGSLTGELTEPAVKVSCYNLLFANPLTGHWLVNDHHNFHNCSHNSFWLLQFTESKAMEESCNRCLTFWR